MVFVRPFAARAAGVVASAWFSIAAVSMCVAGSREFHVTAKKYEFAPARLEVTQGDTVRIVITSADGKHGFGIKELDVKTEVPKTGEPATIEFVAQEAGEFEITCTKWCGKGHKKMKGLLVVKPRAGSS